MSIQKVSGFKTSDGIVHDTMRAAHEAEAVMTIAGIISRDSGCRTADREADILAEVIYDNRAAVIAVLTEVGANHV